MKVFFQSRVFKRSDLLLWLWYLLLVSVIILRVIADETDYLSPDSHYYLNMAESFVQGNGFTSPFPYDGGGERVFIGFFPIGYPLLIAVVHWLTGVSFFVASKLVMLLSLLVIFSSLKRLFRHTAWVPALYFSSFGMLQVFSHSWSEGPFLALEMVLVLVLFEHWKKPESCRSWSLLKLFLILVGLFLFRYAGMFFLPVIGWLFIRFWIKGEKKAALLYCAICLAVAVIVGSYFVYLYVQTGYFSGISRVWSVVGLYDGMVMIFIGVINEFFIIRNYFLLKGFYVDYTFIVTLLLQLSAIAWGYVKIKSGLPLKGRLTDLMQVVCWVSSIYFLLIISIDQLDYRFLAPATMPIYLIVLGELTSFKNGLLFRKLKMPIIALFVFSLLMNLPKVFIIKYFLEFFS